MLVSALGLLAAACTRAERDLPDLSAASPDETSSPGPAAGAVDAPGRLAIVDGGGRIVTLRPDGTDPVPLTADSGTGQQFIQPIWSPEGRRVAWVELDDRGGSRVSRIVTSAVDGADRTEVVPPSIAFYLHWDPTGTRLAYLGSVSEGLELGVVDVSGGGDAAAPLDTGSPYYFSWAPEGDRMVVHVGEDRLERLALDGELATVAKRPGSFRAPVWGADGVRVVYPARRAGEQRLVISDERGEGGRDLVAFDGVISFVLSPQGDRVAVQALGGEAGDGAGKDLPRAGNGELAVLDLETGRIQPVSGSAALAFFWSPGGDRLLALRTESVDGELWLRWHVWGGDQASPVGQRFRPSPVFLRGFLPFFDQFAQTMSLWAPDGSAFAYPGLNETGDRGIWVQPTGPEADPVLVAEGVFVSWSPTA